TAARWRVTFIFAFTANILIVAGRFLPTGPMRAIPGTEAKAGFDWMPRLPRRMPSRGRGMHMEATLTSGPAVWTRRKPMAGPAGPTRLDVGPTRSATTQT